MAKKKEDGTCDAHPKRRRVAEVRRHSDPEPKARTLAEEDHA